MKKTLSFFLALVMAFGCGPCAFAAEPDPSVLHTATGITAVWSGEIELPPYVWDKVEPVFDERNVTVTLTYADQEPKILDWWHGFWNSDWRWDVCFALTGRTETEQTLTFYYTDTSLENAYIAGGGTIDREDLRVWQSYNSHVPTSLAPSLEDYAATLPQATITVPAKLMETFVDAHRPLTQLKPKEAVTVPARDHPGEGNLVVYAYTPKKSGLHQLIISEGAYDFYLFGPDYEFIATHGFIPGYGLIIAAGTGGWSMIETLEAGKTYYLVTRQGVSYRPLTLTVIDGVRELNLLQRIGYFLIGGPLWSTWLNDAGNVYAVPLAGPIGMKLLTVVERILTIPWFIFFALPLALFFSLVGVG